MATLTFAGKDATAEFNMIHPSDVVEKYAPDAVMGTLRDGGEDDSSEGGYTMEEVAKHNKKSDLWGGFEWTCLECFQILVPASCRRIGDPDFRREGRNSRVRHDPPSGCGRKYAPDAIIGVVGNGNAKKVKGASALPVATDKAIWRLGESGGWRLSTTRRESPW